MNIMILMFLTDIENIMTDVENPEAKIGLFNVCPNPMTESATIELPEDIDGVDPMLYDVFGNQIRTIREQITLKRGNLPARMYVYHLENEADKLFSGKILMR